MAMQDFSRYRADFPILQQTINGNSLVYLDNAATCQKPQVVLDTITNYYTHDNANVHRGVHTLSERATLAYEKARTTVQQFINANSSKEIVFVRGTTEAINLVAHGFGQRLQAGDEIILTRLEHHSNIVPWQLLCERTGAQLRILEINQAGELFHEKLPQLISAKTKLLALTHVSNALGTINPIKAMIATAHAHGVPVLIDGAQAIAHLPVDVQDLDCDFYAFSGHKVYGPMGIGVLYAKASWLEQLPPYQGGGDMIKRVSFSGNIYNDIPYKFEAGTPNVAGAVGLAAALNYLSSIGLSEIAQHEQALLHYATDALTAVPGLTLIGTAAHKVGVMSFTLADIHPHDVGTILDDAGVAIRAGHHCAMPIMEFYQLPATARASFSLYTSTADIDRLVAGLNKVLRIFQ